MSERPELYGGAPALRPQRVIGVALASLLVWASVACSWTGSDAAEPESPSPLAEAAPAEPPPELWDDPWSVASETGNDFERSRRLLTGVGCPASVAEPTDASVITVVRAVDGCPRFERVEIEADPQAQLARLREQDDVIAADQAPALMAGSVRQADPDVSKQWHLESLGADALPSDLPIGEVPVAVIDTGMDTRHEDLASVPIPTGGVPMQPGEKEHRLDLRDVDGNGNGHGSHVAGIIGATRDNGIAGRGLAAGSPLLPIEMHGRSLAENLYLAVDAGVRVVNMSIAELDPRHGGVSEVPSQLTEWAVRYAIDRGLVLVASAGNCGSPDDASLMSNRCIRQHQMSYPAGYDGVISVAAVDRDGERAEFSSAHPRVAIAAPGVDIVSVEAGSLIEPDPSRWHDGRPLGTEMRSESGTSQAAPLVAATAALIIAKDPSMSVGQIRDVLVSTTTAKRPKRGWSREFGWGIVDPVAALDATRRNAAAGTTTTGAAPSPVSTAELAGVDATGLCQRFEGEFAVENDVAYDGQVGVWNSGRFDSDQGGPAFAVGDLDGDGVDDGAVIVTCEFLGATSYVPELALVVTAATRQPLRADLGTYRSPRGVAVDGASGELVVRWSSSDSGEVPPAGGGETRFVLERGELVSTG